MLADSLGALGWKRMLLADGPRQVINALTLYAIYLAKKDNGAWYDIGKYFEGNTFVTTALTITTLFTVLVFAGSLLLLIIAGVCYIPLLCYIQGNLKVRYSFIFSMLGPCLTFGFRNTAVTKLTRYK